MTNEIQVAITLGEHKYLGIDKFGKLICYATRDGIVTDYINLGVFTQQRYKELREYLDRLSTHTKD